jgi:hypothetical protein
MSKKRILASLVLPLLLASFLHSQSLTELAKKEKERRAALKGKVTTVTSADVAKVKKRPAVETTEAQTATEGEAQAGEAAPPAQLEAAPPVEGQQAAEEAPPADEAAKSAAEIQKKQKELADKAQEKIEMVELLNLKLNALYQEFQGLDNIKSREIIQLQISDTYDKLLKAETESAKAQKELEDFLADVSKKKTPSIWIR